MLKVLNIVGARPHFMKIAPIVREMKRRKMDFLPLIVHTGQHYDQAMSNSFFTDLGMPAPDFHLEIGSASHAVQTARIMTAFEPVVLEESPIGFWLSAMSIRQLPALSSTPSSMSKSRTSKPVCARATTRCPKKSTAF